MKKTVQIAFGLALAALSIIGTIWTTELIGNIIYAIVIPSFVLSIISFVTEISTTCESIAYNTSRETYETANNAQSKVNKDLVLYNSGEYKVPYSPDLIPREIYSEQKKVLDYMKAALVSQEVGVIFNKCKRFCDKVNIVCYTILFLSLIFSPYIAKWLSVIDLNCISLWSLTLLYITLELKAEIQEWVYMTICERAKKTVEKENSEKK